MTRLVAALEGRLDPFIADEVQTVGEAIEAGITETTLGLKAELRRQMVSAGFGQRLANTWRSRLYPAGAKTGGIVWSKAPKIVGAFAHGATIRSARELYLAIPLPAAGKYGDARQRITPAGWERAHGQRLRFVYRRGQASLLVADNVRINTRGRAVANIGRSRGASFTRLTNRTTVPLFLLVPQVRLKKRLDVEGAHRQAIDRLPNAVLKHFGEGPGGR